MNFDADRRLVIIKAIINLPDSSGPSGFVQNKPRGGRRFEVNAMVSTKKIDMSYLVIITGHFMS